MESILTSIKKLLGIAEDYEPFDPEIIMHINSTLFILNQLGVGPDAPFSISDKSTTWNDFLGSDISNLEAVKTYVATKVKLMWDTSTMSSAAMEAAKNIVAEMEWRLNVAVDPKREETNE